MDAGKVMMTDTTAMKKPSDVVAISKFFGLKGKDGLTEIRSLTEEDRKQVGGGINDGTLTY